MEADDCEKHGHSSRGYILYRESMRQTKTVQIWDSVISVWNEGVNEILVKRGFPLRKYVWLSSGLTDRYMR